MFEQRLPDYKHDFLSFDGWLLKESPHYIFHYTQGSEAERDLAHIVETQEKSYAKITGLLGEPISFEKISYYFYPDEETKKSLMGDDWYALAILNEWCVHVLYTKEDKPLGPHEDTHLLSLQFGQANPFLAEGLADYMVGHAWDGNPHLTYLQKGRELALDMDPAHYLTSADWFATPDKQAIIFYSLAAVWTGYLIDRYGLESYLSFYKQVKRSQSSDEVRLLYTTVFGASLEELSAEFEQYSRREAAIK